MLFFVVGTVALTNNKFNNNILMREKAAIDMLASHMAMFDDVLPPTGSHKLQCTAPPGWKIG